MRSQPKIIFFLFLMFAPVIFGSCNKNNDVIPDVYVDFTLDLNDPQFLDLISLGGSVIVNAKTNNWPYSGGYNDNGIIVYASVDEYYAYDRTCPHDYVVNSQSIKVNIDPTNSLNAICPQCNTNYALSAGGTPAKGVGHYPLKNYKTSFDGRFIRVWSK